MELITGRFGCGKLAQTLKYSVLAIGMSATSLATSSTAYAQSSQVIQELFLAELPYPQARGETQLTLVEVSGAKNLFRGHRTSLGAEFGLNSHWQVETGISVLTSDNPTRSTFVESAEFGLRRSWTHLQKGQLQVAVGAEIEVPLRADGERTAFSPSLSVLKDVQHAHGLRLIASGRYGFGISRDESLADDDAGSEGNAEAHIAAILPIGWVRLTTELSRAPEGILGSAERSFLTPGIVVPMKGEFELGLAFSQSLTASRSRYINIKAIYEF